MRVFQYEETNFQWFLFFFLERLDFDGNSFFPRFLILSFFPSCICTNILSTINHVTNKCDIHFLLHRTNYLHTCLCDDTKGVWKFNTIVCLIHTVSFFDFFLSRVLYSLWEKAIKSKHILMRKRAINHTQSSIFTNAIPLTFIFEFTPSEHRYHNDRWVAQNQKAKRD